MYDFLSVRRYLFQSRAELLEDRISKSVSKITSEVRDIIRDLEPGLEVICDRHLKGEGPEGNTHVM